MFTAYQYGLIRQGLRLLAKACSVHGRVDGIDDLLKKIGLAAPQDLIKELEPAVKLNPDVSRTANIYIFETSRELVFLLSSLILKSPRKVLALFPSNRVARMWAEAVTENLAASSRRLVCRPSLKLEIVNDSVVDFSSIKSYSHRSQHFDAILILNPLVSHEPDGTL